TRRAWCPGGRGARAAVHGVRAGSSCEQGRPASGGRGLPRRAPGGRLAGVRVRPRRVERAATVRRMVVPRADVKAAIDRLGLDGSVLPGTVCAAPDTGEPTIMGEGNAGPSP